MGIARQVDGSRVFLFACLALLVQGAAFLTSPAAAHEVRPAIADVTIAGDSVTLRFGLNGEALLAGIDLSVVLDTNDAANAGEYDRLRSLDPQALAAALREASGTWKAGIAVASGGEPAELALASVEVADEPNIELPRDTVVVLTGVLPGGGAPVTFRFAPLFGEVVLRQRGDMDEPFTGFLAPGTDSPPIPRSGAADESALSTFANYVATGFAHIVPKGLDHILFVLGLFFLSPKLRPLVWQISAFTLAHTITLALATLGYVSVPAAVVEPLIAASIIYVAVENIVSDRLHAWRPVIVFAFGLLHGLGFASVLGDIGLDPQRLFVGLIAFNVGVELGQLAIIAAAYLAVGYWFNERPWYRRAIATPASLAIAAMGAFWFYERVFA